MKLFKNQSRKRQDRGERARRERERENKWSEANPWIEEKGNKKEYMKNTEVSLKYNREKWSRQRNGMENKGAAVDEEGGRHWKARRKRVWENKKKVRTEKGNIETLYNKRYFLLFIYIYTFAFLFVNNNNTNILWW